MLVFALGFLAVFGLLVTCLILPFALRGTSGMAPTRAMATGCGIWASVVLLMLIMIVVAFLLS